MGIAVKESMGGQEHSAGIPTTYVLKNYSLSSKRLKRTERNCVLSVFYIICSCMGSSGIMTTTTTTYSLGKKHPKNIWELKASKQQSSFRATYVSSRQAHGPSKKQNIHILLMPSYTYLRCNVPTFRTNNGVLFSLYCWTSRRSCLLSSLQKSKPYCALRSSSPS